MVRPTLSARSSQGQCPYSLAKSLERQLMKLSSFLVVFGQIVKVPPSRGRKASNAGGPKVCHLGLLPSLFRVFPIRTRTITLTNKRCCLCGSADQKTRLPR